MNLWLSGIKLWLQDKLWSGLLETCSMCPWEQFQGKNVFPKQFYKSLLPTSPGKKSKLEEGFTAKGKVVKIAFYVFRRTLSGKLSFSGRTIKVYQSWNLKQRLPESSSKNSELFSTLNFIFRVEYNIRSFSLWRKNYFHHFFSDFVRRNFKSQNKGSDTVSKAVFDVSRGF